MAQLVRIFCPESLGLYVECKHVLVIGLALVMDTLWWCSGWSW